MKPHHAVLVVGAGHSRLSEEAYEEGFINITNIDTSSVAVKTMSEKYRERFDGMVYSQMDVRSMDLMDGRFNIVLDKGTLDCILCGEASTLNVQKALNEISRVLDNKGVFICISHGQPSYRLTYLQRAEFGWEVRVHTVEKPRMGMSGTQLASEEKDNVHYIYVCIKTQALGDAVPN
jgi:ubiquinone/menaquinone biosynthesis C-methylase UbiE